MPRGRDSIRTSIQRCLPFIKNAQTDVLKIIQRVHDIEAAKWSRTDEVGNEAVHSYYVLPHAVLSQPWKLTLRTKSLLPVSTTIPRVRILADLSVQ